MTEILLICLLISTIIIFVETDNEVNYKSVLNYRRTQFSICLYLYLDMCACVYVYVFVCVCVCASIYPAIFLSIIWPITACDRLSAFYWQLYFSVNTLGSSVKFWDEMPGIFLGFLGYLSGISVGLNCSRCQPFFSSQQPASNCKNKSKINFKKNYSEKGLMVSGSVTCQMSTVSCVSSISVS